MGSGEWVVHSFISFGYGKKTEVEELPRQSGAELAERAAKKIADQMALTLVDVELVKEPTGRFLRFFIDTPGGVSLDHCEAFHRALLPYMKSVEYDYMEVSSPGVDRPLKRQQDFDDNVGETVEVRLYRPINGSKFFTGRLQGLIDGQVVIEDAALGQMAFDKKQVALVKKIFEFDESMLEALDQEEEGP